MIAKNVVKLLNDQVGLEGEASQVYLAMAVWAEQSGFRGTAKFMYIQAEEERGHMFKFIRFLIETGETAAVPSIKEPKKVYKDIEEVFNDALKHELKVTAAINAIMTAARGSSDYTVTNFLQWFIKEQIEEEANVRQVLDIIRMAGKVNMYLADKEIGALRGDK